MKKEVKGQMHYSSWIFILVAALVIGLVPGMAMAKAPLDRPQAHGCRGELDDDLRGTVTTADREQHHE